MALKADFIKDVAARCTEMLTAADYTLQSNDDRDTIRAFASIMHRRIPPRQRAVHKAPYVVPSHLTAGEQHLLAKVAAGGDLWPHQSRKIGNLAAEDAMLNDWGIQHFHLGTSPDPRRPNLIQGTSELLFALVRDRDFYALGIFDHAAWSNQALLDIVQVNWPDLIAPYTIKGVLGLEQNYTEAQAAELRKNNINVIQQRPDGTVHLGMGGGLSTDGKSVAATRSGMQLTRHVKELQRLALAELKPKVAAAGLPHDTRVRLEWRGDSPFAVTDPAAFAVDLTKHLKIPAL